jgi:hypothetical protein
VAAPVRTERVGHTDSRSDDDGLEVAISGFIVVFEVVLVLVIVVEVAIVVEVVVIELIIVIVEIIVIEFVIIEVVVLVVVEVVVIVRVFVFVIPHQDIKRSDSGQSRRSEPSRAVRNSHQVIGQGQHGLSP